ncbi:MAG: hypothetical protein M5U08_21160 [Burkholderiales bacterium]|nr:hypothetical protein [Burkholderiales bacterium]
MIHRPKPGFDNATPSGNGVAAWALNRLGHLTGDVRYLRAAERTIRASWSGLARHPAGFASMLSGLSEVVVPPRVAVLRGARAALAPWARALAREYLPEVLIVAVPEDVRGLPEVLDKPVRGAVNGYICQGVTCLEPVSDINLMRDMLLSRTRA